MNNFGKGKKTRLSKVYFVWVIRDFGSAECEQLLLIRETPRTDESRVSLFAPGCRGRGHRRSY
jgi:NADPH oxidase